jgi:transketolase
VRQTCLDVVYELAMKDERIIFIGSDLGSGTLDEFARDMPDRFFMEGISEGHVIGMAAGLAMEGRIVYVNTIASFLTRRCFEQVVIDLCLHNLNVRLIGNGGGMVYAPLGPTHMTVEDIAIMRAVPNMTVLVPADAEEMKRMMPETVDHHGPVYIRLAKGFDPVVTDPAMEFEIGRVFEMRKGRDALIVSTGIALKHALEASDHFLGKGVNVGVVHVPTVKPLDTAALSGMIEETGVVVTIEEHSVIGGLGSAVAEIIAEGSFDSVKRFKRLGLHDEFPEDYGSQNHLMQRYAIDTDSLIKTIDGLKY